MHNKKRGVANIPSTSKDYLVKCSQASPLWSEINDKHEGASQVALEVPVQVESLGWDDPLEEGMATHSGVLNWRIPKTEEPGGLQSIGSQRARHD